MVSAKLAALQRELSDVKAECAVLKAERTTNEKVAEVLAHLETIKAERDAVIAELLDVKAERDTLAAKLTENEHKTAQTHLADLCDAVQATLDAPNLEDASPEALMDGLTEMKRLRRNLRDVLARVKPKTPN